jgi:hypothetical protein
MRSLLIFVFLLFPSIVFSSDGPVSYDDYVSISYFPIREVFYTGSRGNELTMHFSTYKDKNSEKITRSHQTLVKYFNAIKKMNKEQPKKMSMPVHASNISLSASLAGEQVSITLIDGSKAIDDSGKEWVNNFNLLHNEIFNLIVSSVKPKNENWLQ